MVNIAIGGSLGALLFFSGRFWIGLIVGAGATAAIDYGMQRMLYLSLFMFVNATNRSFSGALQAFGYPFLTSISNIIFTLGFRIIWMQFIYPQNLTNNAPSSSIASAIPLCATPFSVKVTL